jgi:hypothetical protein
MWYNVACWNPNPRMTAQIRGVIRNFIWGGKDTPAKAKVRSEILIQPTAQGGLGIIDPKAQSEALLAKLMVRCRNPTLAKCGAEAQHLEKMRIWSPPGLPNVQSSTARGETPRIGVFFMSLERSQNVNT